MSVIIDVLISICVSPTVCSAKEGRSQLIYARESISAHDLEGVCVHWGFFQVFHTPGTVVFLHITPKNDTSGVSAI